MVKRRGDSLRGNTGACSRSLVLTMKARLLRLDDEHLAMLVGRGDSSAFETLYDRHHAALLAFCRHMVGNREDGEDVLQQAFLRAHKALAEGRAPTASGRGSSPSRATAA